MLILRGAEIRRGGDAILREVSLQASRPGVLFIMGAGGAGKSTLLAALAGMPDTSVSDGAAQFDGRPLAEANRVFVPQNLHLEGTASVAGELSTRFGVAASCAGRWLEEAGIEEGAALLERPVAALTRGARRYLATLAALRQEAALYLVDEPTAGLDECFVRPIRQRLRHLAQKACAVVVTHNRQDCLDLGGHVALFAGGTLQECAEASQFFSRPATAAARLYVETGNCALPLGPRRGNDSDGIWWLVPGLLCGMSRPGMIAPAPEQFRRLADAGIGLLICAEERLSYTAAEVAAHGMRSHHVAIPDMAAPSVSQALDLYRLAEPSIEENRGVAIHCRGGLGRTGTLLASILIGFGESAAEAIAKVRAARPLAIQSAAQSRFLFEFAENVVRWRRLPAAASIIPA